MAVGKIPGFCIMADVMDSRSSEKKQELRQLVDAVNKRYSPACLTEFAVRNGDELFGILRRFSDGYGVLKLLFQESERLHIPLYAGAGIGQLADEDLHNPHEVNGSAVWSASDALKIAKSERTSPGKIKAVRKTFKYYIQASEELRIPYEHINYQVFFLFERIQKRTEKQKEIIRTLETSPDNVNYERIGERFGYDTNKSVNVSKLLQRADYHLIAGAEHSLIALLDHFQETLPERG